MLALIIWKCDSYKTTDSCVDTLFLQLFLPGRNVTCDVGRCNILFSDPIPLAKVSFLKSKLSNVTRQNDCKFISEMADRRRAHRLPCFLMKYATWYT